MFNSASIFGGRISRTSSLILTFLFILAGLILFLSPVSHAAQVTLAWDPETDPNVTGYRVYYGTSSRNYPFNKDAGNNTTITVPNLQDGATYYFAVTAYNAAGIESGYSNEVSYSATATCPYTISPLSQSFSSSSGAGTVSVSSQSGCSWTAASNASWIVVTSNSNGVGSRTVNYSVSTNTGAASRTGTLTIAGQTFTVTQSGASQTQYTLSVTKTGTGTGTVTNNPSGSTFNAGAVVTLSATPYASSTFAGWSGGCSGTSSTCSINMTNNTSVIAAFTLKSYAITATSGANGSISPSGSVKVNYGATQRFDIPTLGFPYGGSKNTRFHWHLADTWRPSARLTFNYGLGYVYEPGQNNHDLARPALARRVRSGAFAARAPRQEQLRPSIGRGMGPYGQWEVDGARRFGLLLRTQPPRQRWGRTRGFHSSGDQ